MEENANFQTRSISEGVQSDRSRTRLQRWSEGCDKLIILKLKIETSAGIGGPRVAYRGKLDTLGGPRNAPIKRIILVIVVRIILVGFDEFFFNFIK